MLLCWCCALSLTASAIPPDERTVSDCLTPGAWDGIRAAYEVGRHAVRPIEDGHLARNPGQAWLTHFDGRGFTTEPDAGDWSWGLELESYGFAGSAQAVAEPVQVTAEGQRFVYSWNDDLDEWYVNAGLLT